MSEVLKIMCICLLCTLLIELFVAVILRIIKIKDLLNIILVNVLTNPIVVSIGLYVNTFCSKNIQITTTIILELVVIIVEALIYKKYLISKKINPFILSLILNGNSYFIGIFLNKIIW